MDGEEGVHTRIVPFRHGLAPAAAGSWIRGGTPRPSVRTPSAQRALLPSLALLLLLAAPGPTAAQLFETSDRCMGCHNDVVAPSGEDVSIGSDWRGTMMANSGRDPYWQAAVRREVMDHPMAQQLIEDECSICHMPMMNTEAHLAGVEPSIFAHLPAKGGTTRGDVLAADGVSCAACHQIGPEGLGTPASFTGGFRIDPVPAERPAFGPFEPAQGLGTVMHSATGFRPQRGDHIRSSELCATCHTLITDALDDAGNIVGRLPEQVPYLEWRHSAYVAESSCQTCHMPVVRDSVPVTGVLGAPRAEVSRHTFLGGNAFMLRLLNRHRDELAVAATPAEMDAAIRRTEEHLARETASLAIENAAVTGGRLEFDVVLRNLAGHKFPTAYPSRRAWLHVRVTDESGTVVFESGALEANGRIAGNDNDADATRYEPHYRAIDDPGEVQIYEAILADPAGRVTTGLLTASQFRKDNRLLPRGFDKRTAEADVAVHGDAREDADFQAGGDRIRYSVGARPGALRVDVRFLFQPIAWRWAMNLQEYAAEETDRFLGMFRSMSGATASTVATAVLDVR